MRGLWLHILPSALRRQLERRGYAVRVVQSTVWMLAERLLRYAIGFVLGIWIARYLGIEQFGLLSYASAFVGVLVWLATTGLDPLVVRRLVVEQDHPGGLLGSLIVLRLAGAALMVLLVVMLLWAVDPEDPRARLMVILIAVGQLPMALDSLDCWFQARLESRTTAIARLTALVLLAAIRVTLILLHAPIEAFAFALMLEGAVTGVAMVAAYRGSGEIRRRLRAETSTIKWLLTSGWPIVLSTGAVAVYQRVDQVMLGEMAGYAEVGAYAIAIRFVEVFLLLPTVVLLAVYPALLMSRTTDVQLYDRRVQVLFEASLWTAVMLALLLWIVGERIVHLLLGVAYAEAATVLAVLAWFPVFAFTGMVRTRVLMAEGALRTVLALELLACGLNVLGNLLLIPRLGARGAALAALGAAALTPLIAAAFSPAVRRCNRALLQALLAPLRWTGIQPERR